MDRGTEGARERCVHDGIHQIAHGHQITTRWRMYAQIYAESLSNLSTGKTMRVWSVPENITFSVREEDKALRIEASCTDRESSGNRGGEYNPVTRIFHLRLELAEVEKLVATALNEKLLKKIGITNLAKIDKISKLELDNEALLQQLEAVKEEYADLQKRVSAATKLLAND